MSERGRFLKSPIAQATHSLFCELGPNPQKNIHLIVSKAADILKCDYAAFGCIESAGGVLRFRSAHRLPARPSTVHELARRICSEIITGKQTEAPWEPPGPAGPEAAPGAFKLGRAGLKAFLGHPVAIDGRRSGALVALHASGREFSESDRQIIALLAGMVAIEDLRLQREEALRRRISLEAMLKDLSTTAIAIEDPAVFIEHALARLGSRIGVGGAFFWRFNPAKKTLSNPHEWRAEGRPSAKAGPQNIPVRSVPWTAARLMKGGILRIDDTRSIPSGADRDRFEEFGMQACLIIPLFSRDTLYGAIGLGSFRGPKSWAAEDVRMLQTAAEILMRCIENRQLTRELDESRKNLVKAIGRKTLALRKANVRLTEEIAAHQKSLSVLRRREAELDERNRTFLELSNALAAVLNHPDTGSVEAEECLITKLETMIGRPTARPEKHLGSLQNGLKELGSLLKTRSTFVYQCLTPMEIQIAKLVMQENGNKEIAGLLNLSRRTVEVHRYNIRKKLQLDKSRTNLKTYLLSLK